MRGGRQVATDAANVLRFMMCVSHDTWSKMHQQVAGTLLLALARLLRSQALPCQRGACTCTLTGPMVCWVCCSCDA